MTCAPARSGAVEGNLMSGDHTLEVRDATSEDSSALQALQARCPIGVNLVVSTVNEPDFFARSKAYKSCKVYVACMGDRIVGSAACALREAVIGGQPVLVGYEFQYFTAPEARRRGVAAHLHQHIEAALRQSGAALSYAVIMEGNLPSLRLFEREGFAVVRTLVMPCLIVFKEMPTPEVTGIRPASAEDLGAAAEFLNRTWRGFDLREPASAEKLAESIERTPSYTIDDMLILERDGEIMACAGMWDWSRITRMTVEALSFKMRMFGFFLDVARGLGRMAHGLPRARSRSPW